MMARRSPRATDKLTLLTASSAPNATTTFDSVRTWSDTVIRSLRECQTERLSKLEGRLTRPSLDYSGLFLDPLVVARIGGFLHVSFRIVFPELRDVGVSLDRHVP